MKTSRQRLLDYVNTHGAATVSQVSLALKMTSANARHHLTILEKAGQVQVIGLRPVGGKGRPANIYGPSSQALGHNLDKLSSALLSIIDSGTIVDQKHCLQRIARTLANSPGSLETPSTALTRARKSHLTQRLYFAISHLNKLNYQARWEAHRQAPRIILGHCPYYAIIRKHPELCQVDAQLLTNLLEEPVEQIKKLSKDLHGRTHCAFHIQQ